MSSEFEAKLYSSAYAFIRNATDDERTEVGRIIDQLLCYDPWIDNRSKITFPMPPAILTLYADEKYWIIYHVQRNTELHIWNIGHAEEPPGPYRQEAQ